MASIHESLKSLGPVAFSDVPEDKGKLKGYLQEHFSAAKFLVESIPQPAAPSTTRSRATSSASSSSDITPSSARTATPTEHESLQKDWGKPIKLSEKDNPLGINVFKLSGKDGRGAWFARRSVHEGLGFSKWKKALQEEFAHSLQIEGGPGSGKVRGLGAEKRPESREVEGTGTLDVWHVSAQFPGPSAPRDFVSLVMTSDTAFGKDSPRTYVVVSKPCEHENCPPQNGLVRGQYESVEFIREIPRSKKAASTTNLPDSKSEAESEDTLAVPGTSRGRTVSFKESTGHNAEDDSIDFESEELDPNPVEWIMITRSDPGGSVPRFLVERGTPGGIVSDAQKFLDWACQRAIPGVDTTKAASDAESLAEDQADAQAETRSTASAPPMLKTSSEEPTTEDTTLQDSSVLSTVTAAATSVLQRITGIASTEDSPTVPQTTTETAPSADNTSSRRGSISSAISSDSFASAEADLDITSSLHAASEKSSNDGKSSLTAQEKELLRLANRKADLAAKLQSSKDKAFKDVAAPTEKEKAHLAKQQSKRDAEVLKAEDRYIRALRSIETKTRKEEDKARLAAEANEKREREKREKAEKKESERKLKEEEKSLENRHRVEVERFKDEVAGLKSERDVLKENVRILKGENMKLVTMMGKLDGGERLLKEMKIGMDGVQDGE